jgi:hypothetical protein
MISGAEALGWPYVALVVGFNNESSGGGPLKGSALGRSLNKRLTSAVNESSVTTRPGRRFRWCLTY